MYWKIFSVVLASMIKTLFAPTIGFAAGLSSDSCFSISFSTKSQIFITKTGKKR